MAEAAAPITDIGQVAESRVTWPPGRPRAAQRTDSAFKNREAATERRGIEVELERWGVRQFIISASNQRIFAGDPAAAVWWQTPPPRGELRVLACDKYTKLADNLHAIRLTLEAMRALERWGAYTAEQAAEGARLALPPPEGHAAADWRRLLGYISGLAPDKQLVLCEHAYRSMSREAAGDEARQRQINLAIEAARKELRRDG
jgi:hypothetical protein